MSKKNKYETILDLDLTVYEKIILQTIYRYSKKSQCEISHSEIARYTHLGETTVKRYLSSLYETGLLSRKYRIDKKLGNIANVYTLNF